MASFSRSKLLEDFKKKIKGESKKWAFLQLTGQLEIPLTAELAHIAFSTFECGVYTNYGDNRKYDFCLFDLKDYKSNGNIKRPPKPKKFKSIFEIKYTKNVHARTWNSAIGDAKKCFKSLSKQLEAIDKNEIKKIKVEKGQYNPSALIISGFVKNAKFDRLNQKSEKKYWSDLKSYAKDNGLRCEKRTPIYSSVKLKFTQLEYDCSLFCFWVRKEKK